MEVNRQRCQACGSHDVRNILARHEGDRTLVFVRCASCSKLVARYELSGYYHHGKGLESYLRGAGASEEESGREWLAEFRATEEEALRGYEEALQALAAAGKAI